MPPSSSVNRQRFARFIARALASARDRGMTDIQIAATTGVGPSTFHRWQRGDFKETPELDRIRAFCHGLGESATDALTALGVSDQRDNPAPEPQLDPDIRTVMRYLNDPNVPEDYKAEIRVIIKMLAQRRPPRRREAS